MPAAIPVADAIARLPWTTMLCPTLPPSPRATSRAAPASVGRGGQAIV